MPLTIRLTTGMTVDEMAPLWSDIFNCLQTYVARYRGEETVENMLAQCVAGKRQLWIVQDETGKVVLTPITEIVRVDATGRKRLVMVELGGSRGIEALPLANEIEAWAVREHGVSDVEWIGRRGWGRLIEPMGFKPQAVIWRKRLTDEKGEEHGQR
jgi:hypothetical protein